MRRLLIIVLIALVAFAANTAILFWSYQRMAIPYLIEPEKNENLPRMLEAVTATGLVSVLIAIVAAWLFRPGRQVDRA